MLKKEEVAAGQSMFPYLTYRSEALLGWKGDSVTNHHCGLRLRHGGPMSQRTQWHVMRSHGGHVTDPRDPSSRIRDPRDPGLLEGPVRREGTI
jgi:hypothetical protein